MIGLALSGGGSRAIAFHLGCLRALDDLGLLERVDVLSMISGGSVIGAYYAFTPKKSFAEFETDIRTVLARGFERAIVSRFLRTFASRTDVFQTVLRQMMFRDLKMTSPRRQFEVVIGTCDLRTGSAFRFGNSKSGSWRLGELSQADVDLALAVAASAAYPLLLPTLDRKWNFRKDGAEQTHLVQLTDGGIYDNLGVQVLEPRRDPLFSIHTFECDYLIVCNAGHGQPTSTNVAGRIVPRLSRAFDVVHRRVQDSAMHRLHQLRKTKVIKGFALPYLGQLDQLLPWLPSPLVPRSNVVGYATDFRAMSQDWINRLSDRGEQLTRLLVTQYLPALLVP